jgi:hypothetical protein
MPPNQYFQTESGKRHVEQGRTAWRANRHRDTCPWNQQGTPLRRAAWLHGYDNPQSINAITSATIEAGTIIAAKICIQSEPPMSKQLYETADGKFVTILATNSENKPVVEERGTNAVFVIDDKATLKKVVPYTVSIGFGPHNGEQAFIAKEGQVAVGDVIVSNNGFGQVIAVGTENTQTQRNLSECGFRKVATQPL